MAALEICRLRPDDLAKRRRRRSFAGPQSGALGRRKEGKRGCKPPNRGKPFIAATLLKLHSHLFQDIVGTPLRASTDVGDLIRLLIGPIRCRTVSSWYVRIAKKAFTPILIAASAERLINRLLRSAISGLVLLINPICCYSSVPGRRRSDLPLRRATREMLFPFYGSVKTAQ